MKNIINKILLGLLISFGAISCKESLELTPEDYFGEGNYWNTESHFVNNMNASIADLEVICLPFTA